MSFYVFDITSNMSFILFGKILVLILLFFLSKLLIIKILGIIFSLPIYTKRYYYSYCSLLFLTSLIFYPLILIVSYFGNGYILHDWALYVFYLFLFLYFLLKIIFLKRLNLFQSDKLFYNILYLCSLELLPYLILLEFLATLS